MSLQDLGAIGELLGAIAVVVTLMYLAKQIRLNTRSMDEARKLALAQTYQMRADALQEMLVRAADSERIAPIIIKLTGLGYPKDVSSLDALSAEERGRFRLWQIAQHSHWDNMFYQYQQGFLDPEYFEDEFQERVQRLADTWQALGITSGRGSFLNEVTRLQRAAQAADGGAA